jgi:hypothetical protein
MRKRIAALAAFNIFGLFQILSKVQVLVQYGLRNKSIRFILDSSDGERGLPDAYHLFANSLLAATIFLLGSSLTVLLRENALAQSQHPTPPGILMATSDEGIRYLMGGIGSDERETIENLGTDYNVKFIFAETSGDYISDVRVVIDDLHGKRLAHVMTNGPWLYVNLPSGSYRVKATYAAIPIEIQGLEVFEGKRLVRTLHWGF